MLRVECVERRTLRQSRAHRRSVDIYLSFRTRKLRRGQGDGMDVDGRLRRCRRAQSCGWWSDITHVRRGGWMSADLDTLLIGQSHGER